MRLIVASEKFRQEVLLAFLRINQNCNHDDATFDNQLPIGADIHQVQTIADDSDDHHAKYGAADPTYTA